MSKNKNINEISIYNDLPIFLNAGPNGSKVFDGVIEHLKQLNINTLDDLFKAYENGMFNDKRKKYNLELKGQTELLMSYYLHVPLVDDSGLKTEIPTSSFEEYSRWTHENQINNVLVRAGITNYEYFIITDYMLKNYSELEFNKSITFYDVFDRIISDSKFEFYEVFNSSNKKYSELVLKAIQNIKFKTSYLKEIKKEVNRLSSLDSTVDTLQDLRNQIKFFENIKNNLDSHILLLQEQFQKLDENRVREIESRKF